MSSKLKKTIINQLWKLLVIDLQPVAIQPDGEASFEGVCAWLCSVGGRRLVIAESKITKRSAGIRRWLHFYLTWVVFFLREAITTSLKGFLCRKDLFFLHWLWFFSLAIFEDFPHFFHTKEVEYIPKRSRNCTWWWVKNVLTIVNIALSCK